MFRTARRCLLSIIGFASVSQSAPVITSLSYPLVNLDLRRTRHTSRLFLASAQELPFANIDNDLLLSKFVFKPEKTFVLNTPTAESALSEKDLEDIEVIWSRSTSPPQSPSPISSSSSDNLPPLIYSRRDNMDKRSKYAQVVVSQGAKHSPELTPGLLTPEILAFAQSCRHYFCVKKIADDEQVSMVAAGF
ncbi:hypothetical protein BC835DRAFT_1421238 [Cytidiella melzeri]|nr:hypothetical protein BC835DRAFT_1421238 [Cytidiella melzeri]